ncbi:hypothetical protein GCM10022380_86880 [Amycolatopsis tucumanensis]|uniref:TIGR00374 family protein n=1 Tax=Amycolatopsis tucumanensis TaxID=401106 RepID=A0ABP7JV78_9PSEU
MRRRLLTGLGLVAVLAIVVLTLRDRVPSPAEIGAALREADPGWLAVAAAAEFVSMGMFARQQRRLLTAFGVTLQRRRILALSYSRSAISISLPAGSAVSAAYAFQQFRAGGADRKSAAAVMVLSGVLSALGLALLYGTGALAAIHPAAAAALVVGAVLLVTLVSRQSSAIAPRHWLLALAAATANWLGDLVCLIAAARAFGIGLGLLELATVYLAVQLVRQIPLTPGGIGVIEVSLLTGLVSAGAAEPAAAAAVLTYRLLSCWLIIPIGLACWAALRRASDVVDRAPLDERSAGEDRPGLGEDGVPVAPRRDVRDEQALHTRVPRQLARLLAGQVHARRPVRGVGPGRLGEQDVDVADQVGQCVAGPGVAGVGERAAGVPHP